MKKQGTPCWWSALSAAAIWACSGCGSSSPIQASNRSPRMYSASACGASSRRKRRKPAVIAGSCAQRWISAIKNVVIKCQLFADGNAFNDHVFFWNVLVHAAATGFHAFNRIDHVLTFYHFCKHAVAPALCVFASVVKEIVVSHVDEELASGGMRVIGTGHCQRAFGVFQTIIRFVFDWRVGVFLVHARLKTAALNHEAINDTVENGVVVETLTAIIQEVFDGDRRFVREGFNDDVAVIGV